MRITFTQSGGFVGAIRGCRFDTTRLPPEERVRLEQLIAASGLDASFEHVGDADRDRRQYDILIDRGGGEVRICCDDARLPEPARPLVRFLMERATPRRPGWEAAEPVPDRQTPTALAVEAGAWGRFDGQVVARWHDDGREMTLVEPFAYLDPRDVRWEAPAGAVVNGASIPRAFWSVIGGPFSGRFRRASVVHDVACMERSRPWQDVHRMYYEACRCGGVAAVTAKTMYYAVYHYGPRWSVVERRTIVSGAPVVEQVVRDETPPPPSAATAEAIVAWFAAHDAAVEAIPTLSVPPGD